MAIAIDSPYLKIGGSGKLLSQMFSETQWPFSVRVASACTALNALTERGRHFWPVALESAAGGWAIAAFAQAVTLAPPPLSIWSWARAAFEKPLCAAIAGRAAGIALEKLGLSQETIAQAGICVFSFFLVTLRA